MARLVNVALVRAHFKLVGGTLHRILADGSLKEVSSVHQDVLVSSLHGERYTGPELAWALLYGSSPLFPVFTLNRDPLDLSAENVVAGRLGRLRFRAGGVPGQYTHKLGRGRRFTSIEACFDDWLGHAREYYAADHDMVRSMEMARDRSLPAVAYQKPVRAVAPRQVALQAAKPDKPVVPAGKACYWFEGRWVVVPQACHPADDLRVRCRKVLAGAERFEFDPLAQMVAGYDLAGGVVM